MNRKGMSHSDAGRLGGLSDKSRAAVKQRHDDAVAKYYENPNYCKQCGALIDYDHRRNLFCGHTCSAIHSNTHRKNVAYCLNCGGELKQSARTYCSNTCQHEYEWKLRKKEIEDTGSFPFNKRLNDTNRPIARRYLEETSGHKCSICGREMWNGEPIPLVTDHIDGDSTNHRVSNLRLVCPNCDALSDTYKNRNVSTRTWRKEYNKSK